MAGALGAKESCAARGGTALADGSAFLEDSAFLEVACFAACCFAAKLVDVVSRDANAMATAKESLEKVLVVMAIKNCVPIVA